MLSTPLRNDKPNAGETPSRVFLHLSKGDDKPFAGKVIESYDDKSATTMRFDGKSWTLTRKDFHSGSIERFTQVGTGALGRVEVFQGKPMNGRSDNLFSWYGTEDKGKPQIASRKPVPLPQSMRSDVMDTLSVADPGARDTGMKNLLTPAMRKTLSRETQSEADRLNSAPDAPGRTRQSPLQAPAPQLSRLRCLR